MNKSKRESYLASLFYEPRIRCEGFLDPASLFAEPASLLIVGEDTDAIQCFLEELWSSGAFDRVVTGLEDPDRFCEQYAIARADTNKTRNIAFYFERLPSRCARTSGIYNDVLCNGTGHGISLIQRVKNWSDTSKTEHDLFDCVAYEEENSLEYDPIDIDTQSDYTESDAQSEDLSVHNNDDGCDECVAEETSAGCSGENMFGSLPRTELLPNKEQEKEKPKSDQMGTLQWLSWWFRG